MASSTSGVIFTVKFIRRIGALGLLALGCGTAVFAETNAIVDLHVPPASSSNQPVQLAPLLLDEAGNKVTTRKEWEQQRTVLRREWLRAMGLEIPEHRPPLSAVTLSKEDLPEFTREYIRYEVEKGVYEDGYLLRPSRIAGKLPAIVIFHPTTPLQAKGVAGLAAEYSEEKRQAVQLVQRGYVVWCPRNFIFDEGTHFTDGTKLYNANVQKMQKRHPHWTGMARMTWDAVRAADFVTSLDFVDATRIGCLGHSLGGKEVLYAAAFDDRYKVAVSSEGGIGLGLSNWEAPWYLGPKIKSPDWKLDNHQVLALVAPRPFLLLAGDFADNAKSWSYLQAVEPVYALYNAKADVGWFDHHLGHRYAPEARAVAEAFFDLHLKK